MLQKIIRMAAESIAKKKKYQITVWELSRLTDRDLSDLGISRSDIQFIAAKHAGLVKEKTA
jgi:uncharacterized protein YjiS (DUF1127 family)